MAYSDAEINDFLALAQEVGITRAKRELGYPKAWSTAQYWAKNRGIEVATDEVMAKSTATREWYKTEEVITIAQEGMNRVYQELVERTELPADDQKKLAEALKKHYEVWANAQGRATNISESRTADAMDSEIQNLMNRFRESHFETTDKESVAESTD